jgi:hypothetical protein
MVLLRPLALSDGCNALVDLSETGVLSRAGRQEQDQITIPQRVWDTTQGLVEGLSAWVKKWPLLIHGGVVSCWYCGEGEEAKYELDPDARDVGSTRVKDDEYRQPRDQNGAPLKSGSTRGCLSLGCTTRWRN